MSLIRVHDSIWNISLFRVLDSISNISLFKVLDSTSKGVPKIIGRIKEEYIMKDYVNTEPSQAKG